VLALPHTVVPTGDGSVSMRNVKLGYYLTKNAKSSKTKQPIFGTMVRSEKTGSKKGGRKQYVEEVMPELTSVLLLKVFHPSTYLATAGGNRLIKSHVKEAVEFAVCKERYLSWLVEKRREVN
jgi:hypothetical protein